MILLSCVLKAIDTAVDLGQVPRSTFSSKILHFCLLKGLEICALIYFCFVVLNKIIKVSRMEVRLFGAACVERKRARIKSSHADVGHANNGQYPHYLKSSYE